MRTNFCLNCFKNCHSYSDESGSILVGVSVTIGMMLIAVFFYANQRQSIYKQIELQNLKTVMSSQSKDMLSNIQNPLSFTSILTHANNSTFASCINDPNFTACPTSPQALTVLNPAGVVVYDPLVASQGFQADGQACTTFDAASGSDACPFRLEVTWETDCPAAPATCSQPTITIKGDVLYRPGLLIDKRSIINLAPYSFSLTLE